MNSEDLPLGVRPHPQSRLSLIRLTENLRQEALSRARAMADIELKREFGALEERHRQRKQP